MSKFQNFNSSILTLDTHTYQWVYDSNNKKINLEIRSPLDFRDNYYFIYYIVFGIFWNFEKDFDFLNFIVSFAGQSPAQVFLYLNGSSLYIEKFQNQFSSISIRVFYSLKSVLKVLISLNRVLISLKFLIFPPFNILIAILLNILMSSLNSSIQLEVES
jgi:hypothetical protein